MNFFYDLPYDIQKKIYFEAHKKANFKTLSDIKRINWQSTRKGNVFLALSILLYNNGATQRELDEYFTLIDWMDGKYIEFVDIIENKYYQVYFDYWNGW
jgi:hypothetical protein|tara:strand:+ start:2091 stop:2387 length:297 start_codon:yes stop_codon:yes gene_type:complete